MFVISTPEDARPQAVLGYGKGAQCRTEETDSLYPVTVTLHPLYPLCRHLTSIAVDQATVCPVVHQNKPARHICEDQMNGKHHMGSVVPVLDTSVIPQSKPNSCVVSSAEAM